MKIDLAQKLQEYCNNLLEPSTVKCGTGLRNQESPVVSTAHNIKKRKKCKPSHKYKEKRVDSNNTHQKGNEADFKISRKKHLKMKEKLSKSKSTDVTEDGFKVVTEIPPDDSDISDAFQSDLEDDDTWISTKSILTSKIKTINTDKTSNSTTVQICDKEVPETIASHSCNNKEIKITKNGFKVTSDILSEDSDAFESDSESEEEYGTIQDSNCKSKITDDGFKIVSGIPSDDSDVDDAFSSDLDYNETSESSYQRQKVNSSMRKIMDDFGIDEKSIFDKRMSKTSEIHQTKISNSTLASKGKVLPSLQIIDHSKKRGKGKKKKVEEIEDEMDNSSQQLSEVDTEKAFKKARYEVFKYGMTGFNKEKRQATRISVAISLGAKPPKNKSVNYKELQVQRKDDKIKHREDKEMKRKQGLKVKDQAKKMKQDSNHVRGFGSQSGRYKDGKQILSKSEIAKIKNS